MISAGGRRAPAVRAATTFLVFGVAAAGCRKDAAAPANRKVKIGIQVSPAMALVMVAKEQEAFAKHGLDVTLEPFTAGKFALQALLGGSLDFAVCGDVPIALATLQGNEVRVVTQVVADTVNEVRVVARKDGRVESPAQYFLAKRRKLATSFGGGPEFYTYNFLKHFGIDAAKVEILSQKPEDMPATLAGGGVDAVSVFDPFAFIAEQRLGGQAVVFRDDKLYSELYVLATRPKVLEGGGSQVADAILLALRDAADSVAARPDDAKTVVQKYTKLDRTVLDSIWGTFDFHIALKRKLIDYWTAEAAWARETGKVPKSAPAPRFETVVAPEALTRVEALAVNL